MNATPLFVIGIPILLVFTVGLIGTTRRLGFWWAVGSAIVLTPVGGFLIALLSGARRPPRPAAPVKPAEPVPDIVPRPPFSPVIEPPK